MNFVRPPWYWTPYIIWLGLIDYVYEQTRRDDRQVLASVLRYASSRSYRALTRLGVTAAFLGVLVLFVAHVAAPATEVLAPHVPSSVMLSVSALLALASVGLMGFVFFCALYEGLSSLYARGLRVLERRAAAAAGKNFP